MGRKPQKPQEGTYSAARPIPPSDLDAEGVKAWESLCDDLEAIGNLAETDRKLIELYARDYSLFRRIDKQLATEDMTLLADNGRLFINPLLNQRATLAAQLRRYVLDCGLSPSDRKPQSNPDTRTLGDSDI